MLNLCALYRMKSITYMVVVAAQFLMSQGQNTGFACDITETFKPAKGVCASGDLLYDAKLVSENRSGLSWWTCDDHPDLVSYCCTIPAVNEKNMAAACRRQQSATNQSR
ncbi:hypothetical protein DFH28DRAFT_950498 [Melampsora americana]|nr:hypothetical protein DFH28DRAFT_950498 [Melampsora americana]